MSSSGRLGRLPRLSRQFRGERGKGGQHRSELEPERRRSLDPPRFMGRPDEEEIGIHRIEDRLASSLPLRVCRVITRLNVGGPSVQATLLSAELGLPTFESTLVYGVEDEREGNYLDILPAGTQEKIRAHQVPELGRSPDAASDLKALAALVATFRRIRPDIVHTHMAKAGTLGRLAARATGVPVVVHTFHGNVFAGYFSKPVSAGVRAWEALLARASDAVIAISPSQVVELLEAGIPRSKIRLVPLGIPLEQFDHMPAREEARAELHLPQDATCIGWVARLVPVKDPKLMVEAAAVYASRNPKTVLLVAGDGPEREVVERLAEARGVDAKFFGWQSDLRRFYAACDVVALSSKNEGFPVALIEAIAAGRPVAATDVGGVADLFQATGQGQLARSRSPEDLAEAISKALQTPAAQLSLSADRARRAYSARRLVQDIKVLYGELAMRKVEAIGRRRRRER